MMSEAAAVGTITMSQAGWFRVAGRLRMSPHPENHALARELFETLLRTRYPDSSSISMSYMNPSGNPRYAAIMAARDALDGRAE